MASALMDEFLRRFESLTNQDPAPRPEGAFARALEAFHRGAYRRCLDALACAGGDPAVAALREAASALLAGRPRRAVRPCLEAIRHHGAGPEMYGVLVVLLLAAGDRARAYRMVREGLRQAPGHPVLRRQLEALGVRRPPVFGFLPRSHPLNRWLGRVRHRYRGARA